MPIHGSHSQSDAALHTLTGEAIVHTIYAAFLSKRAAAPISSASRKLFDYFHAQWPLAISPSVTLLESPECSSLMPMSGADIERLDYAGRHILIFAATYRRRMSTIFLIFSLSISCRKITPPARESAARLLSAMISYFAKLACTACMPLLSPSTGISPHRRRCRLITPPLLAFEINTAARQGVTSAGRALMRGRYSPTPQGRMTSAPRRRKGCHATLRYIGLAAQAYISDYRAYLHGLPRLRASAKRRCSADCSPGHECLISGACQRLP